MRTSGSSLSFRPLITKTILPIILACTLSLMKLNPCYLGRNSERLRETKWLGAPMQLSIVLLTMSVDVKFHETALAAALYV
jgi:hypothetical protein